MAAYLLGRDDDSTDLWARAHHRCVRSGDAPGAGRCGFWLAFHLLLWGEVARSGGWLARARRVLDTGGDDCVEHGYVQVLDGLRAMGAGDLAVARTAFDAAAEIGDRFGDADLTTLGRLGRGQSLIGSGQTAPGVALLDEAMVAVTADDRRRPGISEKTVARHLSNIFTKLGLSSRAAATAYAYEHELV